jgi:hypothetical protein
MVEWKPAVAGERMEIDVGTVEAGRHELTFF